MRNNEIQAYLLGVIVTSSGFLLNGYLNQNVGIILLSGLIPLSQLIIFCFLRENKED